MCVKFHETSLDVDEEYYLSRVNKNIENIQNVAFEKFESGVHNLDLLSYWNYGLQDLFQFQICDKRSPVEESNILLKINL